MSRAILHFVQEGLHSNSNDIAEERHEQVQKLLDKICLSIAGHCAGTCRCTGLWRGHFCYNPPRIMRPLFDLRRRLWIGFREAEGVRQDYHEAVVQLCIGACLLRGGQHDDASICKTALFSVIGSRREA